MPELPEVETTRRGIAPALVGATLVDVVVRERRLRWALPPGFEASLRGQPITSVGRRAKYLLIAGPGGTLLAHLGMSGSFRVVPPGTPLLTHDHVDLLTDRGQVVRYNDPRRFGSLHWVQGPVEEHPLLRHLGPEPLSPEFTVDWLWAQTRTRSIAVKPFLMMQPVVVGVGNIYASESLFRAGISPARGAYRLKRAEVERIVGCIREVLGQAIGVGGTTLRDYVNAEGKPGYFKQQLFVYERAGEPCRRCETPIRQRVQAQRSTYWCPSCQK